MPGKRLADQFLRTSLSGQRHLTFDLFNSTSSHTKQGHLSSAHLRQQRLILDMEPVHPVTKMANAIYGSSHDDTALVQSHLAEMVGEADGYPGEAWEDPSWSSNPVLAKEDTASEPLRTVHRSCAVAIHVDIPQGPSAITLPRLGLVRDTSTTEVDGQTQTRLQARFLKILGAIAEAIDRENSRHGILAFLQFLYPLASIFAAGMVVSSLPIVRDLLNGHYPSPISIATAPRIVPEPAFNVRGIYLHLGRRDGTCEPSIYLGLGGATTPTTYGGYRNLIGVLRRVGQHNSPAYRRAENGSAKVRNGKGVAHYVGLYGEDDTAEDHHYVLLGYIHDYETRGFLAETNITAQAKADWSRRCDRYVLELYEAVLLCAFGLCDPAATSQHHTDLLHIICSTVRDTPQPTFRCLNQTLGLETVLGKYAIGQYQAAATKGRDKLDKRLRSAWCLNGAGAARDNRWERMLCTWVGGNLVQRPFEKYNCPSFKFTSSAGRAFAHMLDPDLPVMDKCELHLPIKGSQHTWPRPDGHKERLVWELHLGGWTFESGGLPACESITLTPYMVDITPGASPAAIRAAARDPARRQRLQLDSDEPPILSLESSRRWDVDPRFKKPDVRRISGARVSYEQRWRIFVTWIHYVCEYHLQALHVFEEEPETKKPKRG